MSWRVVIISGRCKLESKLGYLVCRGETVKKVFISEISTLVVESTAVALTVALLEELIESKVNVIFCNGKHNPSSQLLSLYGRHDCSGILKKQLAWKENAKSNVWTEIVRQKIKNQCLFLKELNSTKAELLESYIHNLETNDLTNREGHAAKVYFDAIFGMDFKRGDENYFNAALNYAYTIILSAFNREIVSQGYNTQIGIAHKNDFNFFNLSCDLMEPFRPIVDRFVLSNIEGELNPSYKHALCNLLNTQVKIAEKNCVLSDAISIYCKSVFLALEQDDLKLIKNYEL